MTTEPMPFVERGQRILLYAQSLSTDPSDAADALQHALMILASIQDAPRAALASMVEQLQKALDTMPTTIARLS